MRSISVREFNSRVSRTIAEAIDADSAALIEEVAKERG